MYHELSSAWWRGGPERHQIRSRGRTAATSAIRVPFHWCLGTGILFIHDSDVSSETKPALLVLNHNRVNSGAATGKLPYHP
ncbi:hypothetical protein DL768_007805 [Monosporascus sp. mg162]|nr:hypothetical protein DL768_007805 [Monosporascus sp. mg162]